MALFTYKEICDILSDLDKKHRDKSYRKSKGRYAAHAIFALREFKNELTKQKIKKEENQKLGQWEGFFDVFKKN